MQTAQKSSRTSKVLALSLGQAITAGNLIIISIVAARMLTKGDYATFRQTFLAYNFAAPILMLGLPNALYYFLPRNLNRSKAVTVENMLLLLGMACIYTLFIALGGYRYLALRFHNPELHQTLRWMVGYPLYVMPIAVIGAVLVVNNKTVLLALYNVITSLALLAGTIIGLFATHTYTGPLIAQIFIPLLFLPVAIVLIFRNTPGRFSALSKDSIKEIVRFAAPLGIASTLSSLMLQLDKLIVSWMCPPEAFAEYVNGALEIPLINIITGSIATVLLADMSQLCFENQFEKALDLFKKAARYSAGILLPIMVFLLITAKPFIITLYTEKYVASIAPFIIFLLIIPIRTVMYGSALMAIGKSKVILYRSFFDLLINMLLSIVFIYFMGYLGAAVATISTLYLWTVPYNLYYIGKGFGVKPLNVLPFRDLGRILLIAAACLAPTAIFLYFGRNLMPLIQLIIASILYFPLVFLILLKYNLLYIPAGMEKYLRLITK